MRRRDDDDDRAPPADPRAAARSARDARAADVGAEVAAEAWIRIGLVHFTVGDFAAALRAFESAQPIATEPPMKYLAHFNAGRALERLQRVRRRDARVSAGARDRARCRVRDHRARPACSSCATIARRPCRRSIACSTASPARPIPAALIGYGSFVRWPTLKSAHAGGAAMRGRRGRDHFLVAAALGLAALASSRQPLTHRPFSARAPNRWRSARRSNAATHPVANLAAQRLQSDRQRRSRNRSRP